jgi:hypothetical protein
MHRQVIRQPQLARAVREAEQCVVLWSAREQRPVDEADRNRRPQTGVVVALGQLLRVKPNALILANLRQLHAEGAQILLRCPLVPQHNARQEHLDGIAALARELPSLTGVELLPYYDLWRAKLARFGLESALPESVKPPPRETVDTWKAYLRQRGVRLVG